jgi:multidrug efflux pump subunit AcrA (membrane-fusion protein)
VTTSTAQTFLLPDVGEGLTEADIISWHVAVGDTVAVNQVIVEIETAKSQAHRGGDGVVGVHGRSALRTTSSSIPELAKSSQARQRSRDDQVPP